MPNSWSKQAIQLKFINSKTTVLNFFSGTKNFLVHLKLCLGDIIGGDSSRKVFLGFIGFTSFLIFLLLISATLVEGDISFISITIEEIMALILFSLIIGVFIGSVGFLLSRFVTRSPLYKDPVFGSFAVFSGLPGGVGIVLYFIVTADLIGNPYFENKIVLLATLIFLIVITSCYIFVIFYAFGWLFELSLKIGELCLKMLPKLKQILDEDPTDKIKNVLEQKKAQHYTLKLKNSYRGDFNANEVTLAVVKQYYSLGSLVFFCVGLLFSFQNLGETPANTYTELVTSSALFFLFGFYGWERIKKKIKNDYLLWLTGLEIGRVESKTSKHWGEDRFSTTSLGYIHVVQAIPYIYAVSKWETVIYFLEMNVEAFFLTGFLLSFVFVNTIRFITLFEEQWDEMLTKTISAIKLVTIGETKSNNLINDVPSEILHRIIEIR